METCLKSVSASYSLNSGAKAAKPPRCVRDLSFSIAENGVTALLGESGSGKTSILRLLAGFLRPSAGSVLIDGREVASSSGFIPPEERQVGVLFQDYALFPHLNVAENILFGVPKKFGKLQRQEILHDLLEACKLNHESHGNLAQRHPHELSGGQMQRVALARVLASRPRLLILDEPFNSVDLELRERMLSHIKQLVRHYQMRMLYITHDKNEAFQIAGHLAIIRSGRLLQEGSAHNLYEKPVNAYVAKYFDKANILPLRRLSSGHWHSPVGSLPGLAAQVEGASVCLRPQHLAFCLETAASTERISNSGQAFVVEQRYYGSYREVHCLSTEFPETPIIVRSATASCAPGDYVRIWPLSPDFHVFGS